MHKNLQTAIDFFDDAENGKGWEVCKKYCTEGATFRGQAGAFDEPWADGPNLGGKIEGFVKWIAMIVNEVTPGCYNTEVSNAYDEKTKTALMFGVYNGTHTKTPENSRLPAPTNKSVKSDFVYCLRFNDDGKIESFVKTWNSEYFMKELGWI